MLNWKLRLQNKATLSTLATTTITAIYALLAVFGVVPSITQDQIMDAVVVVISLLADFGILIDPTTAGVRDSERAMNYTSPSEGSE